jgi:hypothetical protein
MRTMGCKRLGENTLVHWLESGSIKFHQIHCHRHLVRLEYLHPLISGMTTRLCSSPSSHGCMVHYVSAALQVDSEVVRASRLGTHERDAYWRDDTDSAPAWF